MVIMAMVVLVALVVLVGMHVCLTSTGRLLNLLDMRLLEHIIDILTMKTIIIKSAGTRILINVFIDLISLWIETKAFVLHIGKVWKINILDELLLYLVLLWSMSLFI